MPALPEVEAFPLWNQLNDPRPDKRIDNNLHNNCGPESVAQCLMYLTGVELPAGYIKDVMYNPDYTGYTSLDDLYRFLTRYCSVPCDSYENDINIVSGVRQAITAGYPVITLYYWDLAAKTGGHWCSVVEFDDSTVTRANPWGGVKDTWTWPQFEDRQKGGNYLVLRRRRALGDRDLDDFLINELTGLAAEAAAKHYVPMSQY